MSGDLRCGGEGVEVRIDALEADRVAARVGDDAVALQWSRRADGALDVIDEGRAVRAWVEVAPDGTVWVHDGDHAWAFEPVTAGGRAAAAGGRAGSGRVTAEMPGKVVEVLVAAGDAVSRGDRLMVVEAMKMEQTLRAAVDGVVRGVHAAAGDQLDAGALLIEIEAATEGDDG